MAKIQYIKLENFSLIQAAMNLTKIELDFRKTTNTINLIIGSNGSGKTALLSNIHPFATLGHLEARDDSDLIIPEKDGKKTVIITLDNHEFYIEHFYQWKYDKRKISSYIKKDGIELNPAGTVNGFLDVISFEMGIDLNFLKLIRLGGNVTNFIELTSSGRMAFIGKLLSVIEPYLKANKIIRNRSNELTANLKNAVNKMNRLNISNIEILREDTRTRLALLDDIRKAKEKRISDFNYYSGKINIDDLYVNINHINDIRNRLNEIDSELRSIDKVKFIHIPLNRDSVLDHYQKRLTEIEDKRVKLASDIAKVCFDLKIFLDQQDELCKMKNSAYSLIQLQELNEYISKLKSKISNYESKYNSPPELTLTELTSDIDKINSILFEIDNIFTCDDNAIKYFCDYASVQYNRDLNAIHEFAHDRMIQIQYEISLSSSKLSRKRDNLIMFIPQNCKSSDKCPYYNAFNESNDNSKSKDVKSLEYEYSCLEQIDGILSSIHSIRRLLSLRNQNITAYNIDEESVFNTIRTRDKSKLMDSKAVYDLKEHCEDYEEYLKAKDKLKEKEKELELFKINKSKEDIELILDDLQKKINSASVERARLYKNLNDLNKDKEVLQSHISDYITMTENLIKKEKLLSEKNQLIEEMDKCHEKDKLRAEYDQEKTHFESDLIRFSKQIDELEKAISDNKLKESMFNQLTDEIDNIKKIYEYIEDIKDATSNTEGIPMYHVKMYCKSLCAIANDIIKELYTGDFSLLEFKISDNSFTIPYYTKGCIVKDIKDASQAESSVAKIAISFAIISQFMTKYNIILLDEIDGPMHRINKEKFFAAIEGQLDRLKCEQVFMITQSTMFNEYPVNLIVTDPDYRDKVTKDSNVIFQR